MIRAQPVQPPVTGTVCQGEKYIFFIFYSSTTKMADQAQIARDAHPEDKVAWK